MPQASTLKCRGGVLIDLLRERRNRGAAFCKPAIARLTVLIGAKAQITNAGFDCSNYTTDIIEFAGHGVHSSFRF